MLETLGTVVAVALSFGIPIAGWIYAGRRSGRRRAVMRLGVALYTVAIWTFAIVLVMDADEEAEVTLPTFTTVTGLEPER